MTIFDQALGGLKRGLELGYLNPQAGKSGEPGYIHLTLSDIVFKFFRRFIAVGVWVFEYIDAYHFPSERGFGFDWVDFKFNNQERRVVRVYAGGTVSAEKLKRLGLSEETVTATLKKFLRFYSGKTRLGQNCQGTDGKWAYSCQVICDLGDDFGFPFCVMQEHLTYFTGDSRELVFCHIIVLLQIK